MNPEVKSCLQDCMAKLEQGTLQTAHLQEVLDLLSADRSGPQDLLYLQCATTSITSSVLGMQLVTGGEVQPEPDTPADFPYQSVLEAIRDGWRVLQFPNLALLLDEQRTYGLGCEFILER